MPSCVYCGEEVKTSEGCIACGAANPLENRPVLDTPVVREKRARLKEKIPIRLPGQGEPFMTLSFGLLIGLISALVFGLFMLYIFDRYGMLGGQ